MKTNLILLTLVLSAGRVVAGPMTFYVATNGNDQWSGKLAASTANVKDGPFATLSAAVSAARLARQNAATTADGINILVRGGMYELDEPLRLTAEDSGVSSKQPFTIASFGNEKPVLS